jgi:hypothetical protein
MKSIFDGAYVNNTLLLFVKNIIFYSTNRLTKKITGDSLELIDNHGGQK